MAHSDNVLYVEPNYVWDESKIGETTSSEYKEVAPSLEDMCIVVDLEVEIPSKSYNANQSIDNVTYGFQWTVPNNGKKPNVTFFQGTHFKYTDSKGKSFVSTNAYDYATYEDVLKINTTENGLEYNSTSELFGINSIDIEYNNYMVPVVTIKFTDIRGVSLFAPEELRHSTTVDGMGGFVNNDIAGSFFKSFFTFPYPKFKLMVKGIYGEPVAYELSCADFRANFEAQTGNFGATAKFIGYSYSLLSDVTLTALLAAPLNKYGGASYWEQKTQVPYEQGGFQFKDGSPMIKLVDVISSFQALSTQLERHNSTSNIAKKCEENVAKANELNKLTNSIEDYVTKLLIANSNVNAIKYYDDTYHLHIWGTDDKNTRFNTCIDYSPSKYNKTSINVSSCNGSFTSKDEINIDKKLLPSDSSYFIVYDLREVYDEIDSQQTKISNESKQLEQDLIKERNEVIANTVGFVPSVENVNRIVLAHLETLLASFNQCENECKQYPRTYKDLAFTSLDTSLLGDGASKSNVGLFPECTKVTTDLYGTKTTEYGWLGDRTASAPEVKMVNGLLNGIKNVESVLDDVVEYNNHLQKVYGQIANIVISTDLIANSNPLLSRNFNQTTLEDLAKRLGLRYVLINRFFNNTNDTKVITKAGELDAKSFLAEYSSFNEIFAELLSHAKTLNLFDEMMKPFNSDDSVISVNANGEVLLFKEDGKGLIDVPYLYKKIGNEGSYGIPFETYEWDTLLSPSQDDTKLHSYPYYGPKGWYSRNSLTIVDYLKYDGLYEKLNFSASTSWDGIKFDKTTYKKRLVVNTDDNVQLMGYCYQFSSSSDKDESKILSDSQAYCLWGAEHPTDQGHESGIFDYFYKEYQIKPNINDFAFKIKKEGKVSGKVSRIKQKVLENLTEDILFDDKGNLNTSQLTLPRFGIGTTPVFTDVRYYELPNDYLRAIYFLLSWNWKQTFIEFNSSNEENRFRYLPKYGVLAMGAIQWYENQFDAEKKLSGAEEYIKDLVSGTSFSRNNVYYRYDSRQTLVDYFKTWVEDEFMDIHRAFTIQSCVQYPLGQSPCEKFVKALRNPENDKEWWGKIFTQIYGSANNEWTKNLRASYISASLNDNDNFVTLWLREDTKMLNKIVRDLSLPVLVINHLPLKELNPTFKIQKGNLMTYFNSFIRTVQDELYKRGQKVNEQVIIADTNRDIKVSLYRYLKVLWDKWLHGNPNRLHKWSLKEFSKHWYYIDSCYNVMGHKTFVNLPDLVMDINVSLQTQGYNMLSFLFTTLARNKMGLYCVQNFMGMLDVDKMNQMFKPIPYNQIDTSKIDEMPDFIVMLTGEPSSKLDIKGAESKSDSYMIGEYDDIPLAIKTKRPITEFSTNGNGYKIPAFGVTMGKQYQSYFSDIQLSMDSPIVTEQSLRAQFNLTKGANKTSDGGETTREIKALGQDLYTVYSNNSYTCNVQMLGCAWVQPLMYFQLNNVPMFRGTYLIQKVSHHIQPGHMVTNFIGTRMAKLSTPIVESTCEESSSEQTHEPTKQSTTKKEPVSNDICNDCKYEYFDPRDNTTEVEEQDDTQTSQPTVVPVDTLKQLAESVIESVKSSYKREHSTNVLDLNVKYVGVGICELSLPSYNNSETLIQIYDILVSTYDKLLKKCYWVTSNGLAPNILKIQVTTVENDTDRQFAMASPIIGYQSRPPYNVDVKSLSISQMHKEFVKILAKRYNILNANSFKIFQKECPNFGQWTMEEVNNEFKKFDFICVYDNVDEKGNIDETVVNGTKFTWSGLTSNQLEKEANRQTPHNYTNEGSVSHLITNIKNNMGTYRKKGVCAKAVRLAMVGANIIPEDAVKPASACAYSLHLPHWGFKCVHQYISGTKFDFELQEGDIEVVAACPKNVHGHIAVYVDGKWYADKTTNNINPYHDKGRPVKIYRYMRNVDN